MSNSKSSLQHYPFLGLPGASDWLGVASSQLYFIFCLFSVARDIEKDDAACVDGRFGEVGR